MNFILQVKEIKENFPNQIFFDENLSKYSWFNLGGVAKVIFIPKNLNELRKFLGMTGFLRRFIDGFSNMAAPLYDLLKKCQVQASHSVLKS